MPKRNWMLYWLSCWVVMFFAWNFGMMVDNILHGKAILHAGDLIHAALMAIGSATAWAAMKKMGLVK